MRNTTDEEKSKKKHRNNEAVQVVVRCRPISEREVEYNGNEVVTIHPDRGVVEITNPKDENRANSTKTFTYDSVFASTTSQGELYEAIVRPLVASVLEGFNGCIFAYGQTGTGKTYTMEGIADSTEDLGIIPRTFEQIWAYINSIENVECLVSVTYLEIYLEEIRDLLKRDHSQRLDIREDCSKGFYIPALHTETCKSAADMLAAMTRGNQNRTVGATNMNEQSSRSHAIFTIVIEMCNTEDNTFKLGKLNLVDLAGSERQSKTGAASYRLKEASKINQSLSALGNVISAHAENAPHIPYRDSKLTRLLQDSLGGNSKTIMIANISPSSYNYEETATTLRYAHRAKCIKNQPIKNEDPTDAKLKQYQEEILRLKAEIAERLQNEIVVKKIKKVIKKREPIAGPSTSTKTDTECMTQTDMDDIFRNVTETDLDDQLEQERHKIDELTQALTDIENKLIKREHVELLAQQRLKMEQQRIEMEESQKFEREMKEILEKEEQRFSEKLEGVTNLQQQAEELTRNLNKAYKCFVGLKAFIVETRDSHSGKRRDADKMQQENIKQLKLAMMIVDNFVPIYEKEWMVNNARFDGENDYWMLPPPTIERVTHRPQNQPDLEQPTTEYVLQRLHRLRNCSSRYRLDTVTSLQFESALRTTATYQPPSVSPTIRAILDDALQNESDLEIDDRRPLATVQSRSQAQMEAIESSLAIRRETQRRQPKPQARYFHQATHSTPRKTNTSMGPSTSQAHQGHTSKVHASKGHSNLYYTMHAHASHQGPQGQNVVPSRRIEASSSTPSLDDCDPVPTPVQQPYFELRSSRRIQSHEIEDATSSSHRRPAMPLPPGEKQGHRDAEQSSSFDEPHPVASTTQRARRDSQPRPQHHPHRHPSIKE